METDRNGLEVLEREECLQLLRRSAVGRVAVHAQALPAIFPVNFTLADGGIVFRTNPGSKLAAATDGAVVAFEVDDADVTYHAGWSVMVVGVAQEITESSELAAAHALPLRSWGIADTERFVCISLDLVTGRRIARGKWASGGVVSQAG